MKNITILLPVHKLEDDDFIMLNNALSSIEEFNDDVIVKIIIPSDLKEKLDTFIDLNTFGIRLEIGQVINTTTNTEFTNQINLGIQSCETEWFSILEIDDEYTKTWLPSVKEYTNHFKNVDVFLPVIKDINVEGEFLSFTNESLWAYGFTEKQGVLDRDVLLEYQNYQTSGGIYRTNVIKENGMYKTNIKLTFSYEFLLRLLNNGVIIMGIPKIGYQHVNFRENSLFWLYKNDEKMKIDEDETKFWVDTAKKEYFFKNKRDISYVKK
jgi:hypothetical protein